MIEVRYVLPFVLVLLTACGTSSASPSSEVRDAGPDATHDPPPDAAAPVDAGDGGAVAPTDAATASDASAPSDGPVDSIPFDGKAVSVSIDTTKAVAHLDSTFAGFSYEKPTVSGPMFRAADASLLGLYKLLGPGMLRIGANGVDKTVWNATGKGGTKGEVAPADIDGVAGFVKASGWKIIYAVNMKNADKAAAADECAYAVKAFGDGLLALEVGNEPDLYAKNGYRATTYTYADYRTEWEGFASAIRTRTPGAPLSGTAAAYNSAYTIPFAKDEKGTISLLTHHRYTANGQIATSTITKLLDSVGMKTDSAATALVAAATTNGIKGGFRYDETNSYYNGGASGVSNSYASALWAVDYMFMLAQAGVAGVNFHTGGNGTGYTPIADQGGVIVGPRPEYYGVLLFSLAARGTMRAAVPTPAPSGLSTWAVTHASGGIAVVIVNKDATAKYAVDIDLGRAPAWATRLDLNGPSLDATTDVTLGATTVSASGGFAPTRPRLNIVGTHAHVGVLAASAVLVFAP